MKNLRYLYFILLIVSSACERNSDAEPDKLRAKKYDGPLSESVNFNLIYSDSAKVKVKVTAKKQAQYENGNWELTDSVRVYFFEANTTVYSTMKADKAFFDKQKNVWKITGDVEVRNLKKEEVMTTTEIFWNPNERKIYNNVPVRIETPVDLLNAQNGLEAEQDFSEYRFKKPSGSFMIQEPDEEP